MTRLVLTDRIYKLNKSGQELQFHTNSIMTRLVLTDRIYKLNKSGQELQFHTNSIMTRLVLTDRIYKLNKSGQEAGATVSHQLHMHHDQASSCRSLNIYLGSDMLYKNSFAKQNLTNKSWYFKYKSNLFLLHSIGTVSQVLLPTCFLDFCALLALMLKYFCIWFWFLIGSTFHCI